MKPRTNNPKKVIWHHSNGMGSDPCAGTKHHTADIVDAHHKTRWPGFTSQVYKNSRGEFFHCGYHLVIDTMNDTITQTRAFSEEGAHCIGMNRSAIGVLILGNYDKCSGESIPDEKKELFGQAWDMCKKAYPSLTIKDNVPHRKYATKSCYGDSLDDLYIQNALVAANTAQDYTQKEKELMRINSIQKDLIEAMWSIITALTQQVSGKRLSLREVKNTA